MTDDQITTALAEMVGAEEDNGYWAFPFETGDGTHLLQARWDGNDISGQFRPLTDHNHMAIVRAWMREQGWHTKRKQNYQVTRYAVSRESDYPLGQTISATAYDELRAEAEAYLRATERWVV